MRWRLPIPRLSRPVLPGPAELVGGIGTPGRHETRNRARFGDRVAFEGEGAEFETPLVIVAFTNRCGSNLLADYLRQTGRVGGCGEFLNQEGVARRSAEHEVETFPDYIRQLATQFSRPGRSLGLKASWDQLAMLLRWNIPAMFPGVVLLHPVRHDLLRQAVSYVIAQESGQWSSRQAASDRMPDFDPARIARVMERLQMANRRIELISEAHDLPRWTLSYEEMCRDPEAYVPQTLRAAELAGPDWTPRTPRVSKQADARNETLVEAFLAHVREQV